LIQTEPEVVESSQSNSKETINRVEPVSDEVEPVSDEVEPVSDEVEPVSDELEPNLIKIERPDLSSPSVDLSK
jgi:hypothetical protein